MVDANKIKKGDKVRIIGPVEEDLYPTFIWSHINMDKTIGKVGGIRSFEPDGECIWVIFKKEQCGFDHMFVYRPEELELINEHKSPVDQIREIAESVLGNG